MPEPSTFENMLYGFLSKMPFASSQQPTSIAQARITHTPIGFEPSQGGSILGETRPNELWKWYAWDRDAPLAGIDPNTRGNISIYGNPPQHVMKHEIIHAATIPDLDSDKALYSKVQKLIPQDVSDDVKSQYEGTQYDPVHEGVSWLLTFPNFQGPKYNDAKMKIINSFPATTRAKITRILGQ